MNLLLARISLVSSLALALALASLALTACGESGGAGGLSSYFGPSSGQCSSGLQWNGGTSESAQMTPGGNCITCHQSTGEGPRYSSAGTVMGALDDKNNCSGVAGITVEITDSAGKSFTMVSNSAGNFFSSRSVSTPYTAKLIDADGNERAMVSAQTDPNCANCHSAIGSSGAPGRLFVP